MFRGTLYPFQEEARDRLIERGRLLLALPPGSGKTITSLAGVEALMESGDIEEPGIVLVPVALKHQWRAEIERWTDSVAAVVSGPPAQRKEIYERFRDWRFSGLDYLITGYDSLRIDADEYRDMPRGFLIADEVTALKGFSAKRTRIAKELFRRTPVKVGLSGTPIENGQPHELFSIMETVDPRVLGRFHDFDKAFIVRNRWGGVERFKNLGTLHKRMEPAMVRRTYDDPEIAAALPDKVEKPPVLLEPDYRLSRVLRRAKSDLRDKLDEALVTGALTRSQSLQDLYEGKKKEYRPGDELRGQLMSIIGAVRMLTSHPAALQDSAARFRADEGDGSSYAAELDDAGLLDGLDAPKIDALREIVDEMLDSEPRTKCIVFSSFAKTLPHIAAVLPGSVVYHGGLSEKEREERRLRFKQDPDCRYFVSSDAGGYGVDLPEANLLVHYDLPWQPGLLVQRSARPLRISSTWKTVVVETLAVQGSLDEWQLDMIRHKEAVSQAILAGRGITSDGGVAHEMASLSRYLPPSELSPRDLG